MNVKIRLRQSFWEIAHLIHSSKSRVAKILKEVSFPQLRLSLRLNPRDHQLKISSKVHLSNSLNRVALILSRINGNSLNRVDHNRIKVNGISLSINKISLFRVDINLNRI